MTHKTAFPVLLMPFLLFSCDFSRSSQPDPTPSGATPVSVIAASGREILEWHPDSGWRVEGQPSLVPEQATVRAVFHAVLVDPAGQERPFPGDARIQDARFMPGQAPVLAYLDAGDRLMLWNPSTGVNTELATSVFPGFSFSPNPKTIAYTSGIFPEMELFILELDSQRSLRLVDEDGPVMLPAFSPDGREIVYVSSLGGHPSLAVIPAAGGTPRRITNKEIPADGSWVHASRLAPAPDGRQPPLWTTEGLLFENANGLFRLDPATGRFTGFWSQTRLPVIKAGTPHRFDGHLLSPLGSPDRVQP